MIKKDILPLNRWTKILLSLIILFVAIDLIIILFAMSNRLDLQRASGYLLSKSGLFFLGTALIMLLTIGLGTNAEQTEDTGLFILSAILFIFPFLFASYVAILLVIQYVEFTAIFIFLLVIISIIVLLRK